MNKKTLRIAGWALGLSMAVAGIGVAVGTVNSFTGETIEARAEETPVSAFSFSRSGSADTVTSGYAMILTNYKSNADNYQDKSSSVGLDIGVKKSSGTIWTVAPTSISLTVKVGAGSTKDPLVNNVEAYLIDSSGKEIAGTTTTVTTKVETAGGKNYKVSVPSAANAAGIMIHHAKESSYNVRIYEFSLSYVPVAVPKCTVTYKANWGEQSDVVRSNVDQGSYLLEANPFDAPSGQIFKGWKVDNVGDLLSAGNYYTLSGDTSFYAQWVDKSSIIYHSNEGTGSMDPDDFESGTTATVATNGFTAPAGTKFKCWNTQSDGKGTDYAPEATILSFSSDLDLYAIWEESKTFTLEYSGSTTNMSGGNDAATLGLNADDWNVYSTKNSSASYQIGLNKAGHIALYYYDGGDGNELHIEAKNSSPYLIDSLTLDVKQDADHKVYKIVNSTPSEVTGEEETYDIGGARACYVKNTKTTSGQLQLNSIELGYDYVPSFETAQAFEASYVKKGVAYTDGSKGTNCLTWYDEAIEAYNDNEIMGDEARVWFASRDEFANARARLIAWAEANQTTLSLNAVTGAISYSAATVSKISDASINSSTPLIITVAASVGLLTTGGIFLISRRRREE